MIPKKVLAIIPGWIPSTFLQIINPLTALYMKGLIDLNIQYEFMAHESQINWADIVVFCRNIEPLANKWLDIMNNESKPFIYDLDDNFFELPDKDAFGKYINLLPQKAMLNRYVKEASRVRVYSNSLQETIKKYNNNCVYRTPPLDWSKFKQNKKRKEKIQIAYATSRKHDELYLIFLPAMLRILDKYENIIEVSFWGYLPHQFKGRRNIKFFPFNHDYEAFVKKFSAYSIDIGLAPLYNDLFHQSKTNNKFREYAASRIAGVYSNVGVYQEVVNNKTGMLVSNNESDWYDAISLLIENSEKRESIKNEAFNYIKKSYSQDFFEQKWLEDIENTRFIHPEKYYGIITEYLGFNDQFYMTPSLKSILKKVFNRLMRNKFSMIKDSFQNLVLDSKLIIVSVFKLKIKLFQAGLIRKINKNG